ncbi:MAG TPA: SGNH/GDSL hydrolase family protein, partial [Polyangiales bacterium]|nr:SGNH/GDSL hydrolase family protein [Polyangiales bacterium]
VTIPAGTGGAAGAMAAAGSSGAAAGSGGGAAGMPATEMDYGKGDGSDVVTIGDSWMNILTNGGGIEGALDRAGTKYRHYAIAGTLLLNGQIPSQYDQAKRENPKIATVILTAGGNDVMFSGGCNTKAACEMSSQRIADGLNELYTKLAADGVTTTVYIQYSRNAGTAPADTRPDMPASPAICTSGKIRCLGINTTDLIAATDTVDGIHPTRAGCDRIAKRTLETMEMRGVRR